MNDYEYNDNDSGGDENNRLELSLQEDNELSFKLVIEGAVSNPDLATPNFRFTVMEAGSQKGWVYPVRKDADDVVTVSIPAPINEGFKTGKLYEGKLEVIIGRLYFSPAEMMFEFKSPVEVQAAHLIEKTSIPSSQQAPAKRKMESVFANEDKAPTEKTKMPSSVFAESDEKGLEEEIASVIAEEKKQPYKSNRELPKPINRPLPASMQQNAKAAEESKRAAEQERALAAEKRRKEAERTERLAPEFVNEVFKESNFHSSLPKREQEQKEKSPIATQSNRAQTKKKQSKLLSEQEEKLAFKAKLFRMFKSALTT